MVALLLALLHASVAGDSYAQRKQALDPGKALTQYVHRVWRDDDGLPQNTVRTITQSEDGYLWLGTEEGLVRFDGVRFTVFDKTNTAAFEAGHSIETLFKDREGHLWIGTSNAGLIRYTDGRFIAFAEKDGLAGKNVTALSQGASETLWIGTWGTGLFRFEDGRFTRYGIQDGLPSDDVTALFQDRQGLLWVGTSTGLSLGDAEGFTPVVHHGSSVAPFITTLFQDRAGTVLVGTRHGLHQIEDGVLVPYPLETAWISGEVQALWEDAEGSLWIGVKGGGLGRVRGGRLETFSEQDGLSHDWVQALYGDREGSLWIGTEGGGLNRLGDSRFTVYTTREGLAHDMVMTVFEDREGSLWIGTDGGGLSRLQNGRLTTYTTADGLSSDIISSIHQDHTGDLWIGTIAGGLNRLKDGVFTRYATKEDIASDAVYALASGADGSLWIGTDSGLSRLVDGQFTHFTTEDGLAENYVAAIHEDREGTLWVGTFYGGLSRLVDGQFTHFTTEDGLGSNTVLALHEDAVGVLWVGTYGGGLSRLKGGILTTYTTRQGLFDDNIYQILEDEQGTLWMSCNKGLFAVSKDTLDALAEGAKDHFASRVYGKADGLRTTEMTGGIQPAGWKRRDGTLWFASVRGAVMIDPPKMRPSAPVPVVIEDVRVDKASVTQYEGMTLAPGRKKIEFQYTALSFIAPEAIRFRYILEGYDDAWQDAGTSRTATYTNLPPGLYTFRVMIHDGEGRWRGSSASISFTLEPFFYQTTWFLAVCLLAVLALGMLVYRWRIRRLKAREQELEALVDVRTQDLRKAKEKIEAQTEKLQELDRFKTRFFVNVSHEFRTPLTMIVGPLENALQGSYGPLSAPIRRQIEIMLRNALRLTRLINQLLDLSKLESGKMQLQARPRDIVAFLEGVVLSCSAFAEQKGITLRVHADHAVRGIYFEPDKLEKVFFNLISNASKFTPTGGEIVVTITEQPPTPAFAEGAVEVRVRDTGAGIPADALPYIFDRFRQVDNSNTREHEGTGIGLALVKELILLHHGTIDVSSEIGKGTEFVVVLPRGNAHLAPEELGADDPDEGTFVPEQNAMAELAFSALSFMPEAQALPVDGPEPPLTAPLVLVVEDNADVREYVASILGQSFRVMTACNGEDGLAQARRHLPDLVVSDVMMPRMDGNALCRAIKADPDLDHIPVILLTARATQEMRIEGLAGGADDYLAKPFNDRELKARVENLILLRRQQKELKRLNEGLERTVEEQVQIILRDRIAYEKELLAAKEEAETSLQLKSSILNNMNHEFRTPLTAIRGYAQILATEISGELQEFASLIDQSGTRLMRTLDAVKQLSYLETNPDVEFEVEPVDLVQAVRDAMQRFKAVAEGKGLSVRLIAPEKVEAMLSHDSIERVLDYLLDNAIKFTDEGVVSIEVRREANQISLCVQDTGVGIDADFLPHLFEAFMQESTGLARSHEGIGIGLTVAQRLIHLLGGSIHVESEKEKGSRFTVHLPVMATPTQRTAVPMSRRPHKPSGHTPA